MSKSLRRALIFVPLLALALYFIPYVTALFLVTGLVDVLRNDRKDGKLFRLYFAGNGILTWLLSPFNLLIDLVSYRNRGVWTPADFPEPWRREITEVLGIFDARKDEILAEIDRTFETGKRGMYVFQWYGKHFIRNVPEFNRDYKYIRTIAVSVFSGRESTSYHFGPLRLSLRVLYNLRPAQTDKVFIECGNAKNLWRNSPLFIFDDTLLHRSVNEHDGRRYCVFMDIIRPSPVPGLLSALLAGVSRFEGIKSMFYKNWKMINAPAPPKPLAGPGES